MSRTIFGQDEIDAWQRVMKESRPWPPTELEWPEFPQVEAFNPGVTNAGMVFRMVTRDGDTIEFLMNPVAARHLAAVILTMGQQGGWLDEDLMVVPPPFELDS